MPTATPIKDVQSGQDTRAVAIDRVGVSRIVLPMRYGEDAIAFPTVGEWTADTNLSADVRGTHMSRLMRTLNDAAHDMGYERFCSLPADLMQRLDASECRVTVRFTYFIEKSAPISKEKGFLDVGVMLAAHRSGGRQRQIMQVTTPVTSLCPCSKEISMYGAHNQRSHVTLSLESDAPLRVRDLVALTENGASCELYSVLKRPDERHVTEHAYDNPKFVEDIVRELAVLLEREPSVLSYHIRTENFESIHNHSAYAEIKSSGFPADMLR